MPDQLLCWGPALHGLGSVRWKNQAGRRQEGRAPAASDHCLLLGPRSRPRSRTGRTGLPGAPAAALGDCPPHLQAEPGAGLRLLGPWGGEKALNGSSLVLQTTQRPARHCNRLGVPCLEWSCWVVRVRGVTSLLAHLCKGLISGAAVTKAPTATSLSITWEFLRCRLSGPAPDLMIQTLPCNTILR